MPTKIPPDIKAADDEEWNNRANWRIGLFYYSQRDSRAWVPKKSSLGRRRMGVTPNLAKPQARAYLGIVMGGFLILFLTIILLERWGILR